MANRAATAADLVHLDDGRRPSERMALPGAHGIPGAMSAEDAFAIAPDGTPYEMPDELADPEEMGEGSGYDDEAQEMTEDELRELLEHEESDSVDFIAGGIATERGDALDYFYGRPFGNEEDNESQAISTDVFDVVQTLLPALMKPLVSSDDTLEFRPLSADDEEAAEQETAYVQNVLMERNEGFAILYKWLWDGLAQKNGVVKYWWDKTRQVRLERYFGITMDVLALLLKDGESEVVEAKEYPGPAWFHLQQDLPPGMGAMPPAPPMAAMGGPQPGMSPLMPQGQPQMASGGPLPLPGMPMAPPPPPMLYDVVLRIKDPVKGEARIANVPPEEFLICRDATDTNPKKARFCEHRTLKTISDIREMGLEIDDDAERGDIGDITGTPEFLARHQDDDNVAPGEHGVGANRVVLLREMYYRVDFDGDGIAELRCIQMVGRQMLANYEVEEVPFSAWTPYIIPHKYFGVSPADMAMDTQLQKSTIKRQILNNAYGINNNRAAISNRVNVDDILDNVINGFVRINAEQIGNDIVPMAPQPIINDLLPAIQYLDGEKENRQGYSRANKGLDVNALNKTTTATEIERAADQSQERVQLMARVFAETGLKDLVISLHGLIRRHGEAPDTFRLLNEWVTVDPRNWRKRNTMTVLVGLGAGNKDQEVAQLSGVIMPLLQQGMQSGMVQPKHLYHAGRMLLQKLGYKDASEWMNDPGETPLPPPPKPESIQVEEIRAKTKQAELQQGGQLKQAEMQQANQLKQAAYAAEQEVQRSNDERDLFKYQQETALKDAQHAREMDQQMQKFREELASKERIAEIEAATKLEVARIGKDLGTGQNMVEATTAGAGIPGAADQLNEVLSTLASSMSQIAQSHSAPRPQMRIVRDQNGRASSLEPIQSTDSSTGTATSTQAPAALHEAMGVLAKSMAQLAQAHSAPRPQMRIVRDQNGRADSLVPIQPNRIQ